MKMHEGPLSRATAPTFSNPIINQYEWSRDVQICRPTRVWLFCLVVLCDSAANKDKVEDTRLKFSLSPRLRLLCKTAQPVMR